MFVSEHKVTFSNFLKQFSFIETYTKVFALTHLNRKDCPQICGVRFCCIFDSNQFQT